MQFCKKTFLNNRIGWNRGKRKFTKSGHGGIHFFIMGLPALDVDAGGSEPTLDLGDED